MRFLSFGFLCTSVLGLFAPLRLPAQGSAVGGVVVTRASGAPIGDAQVSVSGTTVRAVTTRPAALFAQHAHDLHALPRLDLACDDTSSTLRCKVDGVYRAIQSRFGDPVARM